MSKDKLLSKHATEQANESYSEEYARQCLSTHLSHVAFDSGRVYSGSMDKRLPDTSEAEEWIDADTFIVKGKTYHVGPDGTVSEVVNEREPHSL